MNKHTLAKIFQSQGDTAMANRLFSEKKKNPYYTLEIENTKIFCKMPYFITVIHDSKRSININCSNNLRFTHNFGLLNNIPYELIEYYFYSFFSTLPCLSANDVRNKISQQYNIKILYSTSIEILKEINRIPDKIIYID